MSSVRSTSTMDAHRAEAQHPEKTMTVKPIPDGYHTLTPYLTVQGASKLIEFVERAFGASVNHRFIQPDGSVGHAELQVGTSRLMVAEATEKCGPKPATLYVYVADANATYKKALEAGAVSTMEPADMFYGDRNAGVKDAFGNDWWIATHIEDVSPEEMARRAEEAHQQRA